MTTTWLSAAVTAADDAVRNAAHRGGGELAPMGVPELAELGASLDHLLSQLATWTHRVAPRVAELPAHHELREDTGTVDPTARCHQAADHLTQVSAHLAAAQSAAQDFRTAIAHLAPQDDED